MAEYFAQGIGFLGALFVVAGYSTTNDNKLVVMAALGAFAFSIHYYLLGGILTSIIVGIAGIRTLVSYKTKNSYVFAFFMLLTISPLYFTGFGFEVVSLVGSLITTFALFKLTGTNLRIALMFAVIFFLANDILLGSISGIATNAFALFSLMYALIKIKRDDAGMTPA